MRSRSRFLTPPYDVVISAGPGELARLTRKHPHVQFGERRGKVVAQLAAAREVAASFAAEVERGHELQGWIVSIAYRDERVTEEDARAKAEAELLRIRSEQPELRFSPLRSTVALGNPMTWAFFTEVHSPDEPEATWRRYVEVDSVTGGIWGPSTYAEYRRLRPSGT